MNGFVLCGIRFDHLPPEQRFAFEFTEEQLVSATTTLRKRTSSLSVMIIATCDRIEAWCEQPKTSIGESMLRSLGLSPLAWARQTYAMQGGGCIPHLFTLACGLLSPLFGEDQILAQLLQSIQRSRICGCSSPRLESLCKYVITSVKQVHTKVSLQVPDVSVAKHVADMLVRRFVSSSNCEVLVIGGSALSRLVAEHLYKEGFVVSMTFRDIEKADLLLPNGVGAIPYEQRINPGTRYAAVISASKSLGYTLTKDQVQDPCLCIDLAEVRDLDPHISQIAGVELFHISEMGIPLPQRQAAQESAMRILQTGIDNYLEYEKFRLQVEDIQNISVQVANDLVYRLNAPLSQTSLVSEQESVLREALHETARKVVAHHLYEQRRKETRVRQVDLSRVMVDSEALYPGDPATHIQKAVHQASPSYQISRLECCSHAFTHMDSPAHVFASSKTLDQYPVSRFFATAYVMDSSSLETIGKDSIEHVPQKCDAVLFFSGKEEVWNQASYLEDPALLESEAISFLLERGVRMFGFDSASCDSHDSLKLENHHLILQGDGLILENLCNLRSLVGKVVSLVALPLSFKESDGAPTRVIATYTP